MGTVVHFETRVPTVWESTHLPVVLLTGDEWNPSEEVLMPSCLTKEDAEMQSIKSLMPQQVNGKTHGETDAELGKISCVYNEKEFRDGDSYLRYKLQQHIEKMLTRSNTNGKYMV
jgi:hypothetical protein